MDKIKGNHAHDNTHATAGDAYDRGTAKHHTTAGTHGSAHGTTHGTNTTGAAYGEPAGRSAIPGQEPYSTHGDSTHHTGLTGSHGDQYNTAPGQGGVTGSSKHDGLPGGAAGYGSHGQDTRGSGAYNTQDTLGQERGTDRTSATGLTGHHDDHSSNEKGFLGRKKDDLEGSLSREQKAKAELDAAMARHNEARTHADRQLNEKEQGAQAELRAAEERLREAQETRRKAGH